MPSKTEVVMTPAEMLAKMAEMEKALDQKDKVIADRDVAMAEMEKKVAQMKLGQSGWLVTVPNPLYDGVTLGIQFVNGQAFVPDNREVAAFIRTPMKEENLRKLPEAERKGVREREKIPSSELAAKALQSDFGYSIRHFDPDDPELKVAVDRRAKERAEEQFKLDQLSVGAANGEGVMLPNRTGIVSRG